MSEKITKSTNFIRNHIENNLRSGLHSSVKTRFPPEPNGYLHIGHAKSICLNFGMANDFHGTCNLRFDDTNPSREDVEFVNSIKDDVKWLGFDWEGEAKYSSNYFDKFYECAIELVNKGLAYVCFLSSKETREYRGTLKKPGRNSPHRDSEVNENLRLLNKMRNGDFTEGECVLRAKINMSSSFMCMRDPTLYRVRFDKHHQTGSDWKIYPMYDFAHCISDAIEGVTHSLCTLEFQDNRRIYDWLLENLNEFNIPNRPHQYEFSRLNLEYTVMSKRKLQKLVEDKLVSDWDDPRMPTISGLRRRGYTAQSLRDFAERVGISKVDSMIDMSILEASIRDDLNVIAPRTMAVIDPIRIVIENYPEHQIESINAPVHPQNESMGKREILFGREVFIDRADFQETALNNKYKRLAIDKEVRLRNCYVIKAKSFDAYDDGSVSTVYATYDPDTLGKNPLDGRKVKGVIHFVEATKSVKAEFRIYDRLFTIQNPASVENFEDIINPDSLVTKFGVVEPNMASAKPGLSYQFEREGYFCRDSGSNSGVVFNKTVGLRDTWNK